MAAYRARGPESISSSPFVVGLLKARRYNRAFSGEHNRECECAADKRRLPKMVYDMANFQGDIKDTDAGRYAIVISRYNGSITSKLLDGALRTLQKAGVAESQSMWRMCRASLKFH